MEKKHLWQVEVAEIEDETLWITTHTVSIHAALLNAHKFIAAKYATGINPFTITGVSYQGTIDA
jgi:hypothetical protein